jgi:phosphate transport system substrate-binding protein
MKTLKSLSHITTPLLSVCLLSGHLLAQEKTILIDGSSTVYPIMKLAAETYAKETGAAVKLDVSFSGTTGGFRKFVEGATDIQDASRPILGKEIAEAKARGVEYIEIPIAYDALTIAVHPANDWADAIKTSELKKMWEAAAEGKVTRWNQIRPEWPDAPIALYGAGADSGTHDYFAEVIAGPGGALRRDFTGSEDDNELVAGIEANPHALGFIPYAYFSAAADRLKALAIQWDYDAQMSRPVESTPVMPSNKAVYNGYYVPLGRPLFLYVNARSLAEKPWLGEFLDFFLDRASAFIRKVNYLPLSEIAYRQALRQLDAKTTGTRFGGSPVAGVAVHDILTVEPE